MATPLLVQSGQCTYRCTYESPAQLLITRLALCVESQTRLRDAKSEKLHVHELERESLLGTIGFSLGGQQWLHRFIRKLILHMNEVGVQTKALDRLLYSVADAAQLLSCSRTTVYSLIRSGEILAVYPTSKARITRAALERYVEKKEAESRTEQQTQRSLTR